MAQDTQIQWTHSPEYGNRGHTWNPWHGCRKVSPGCKYCYMYRDKTRWGQNPMEIVTSQPATFFKPLHWKEPALVFTCSWSDWFISEADAWRPTAWEVIKKTPHLTYQILTKRPERIIDNLPPDWGEGYPNVWIGISAEDQETFNERVPILAKVPAAVRFLSLEPLLRPINFLQCPGWPEIQDRINWVIVGGESGNALEVPKPTVPVLYEIYEKAKKTKKYIGDQKAQYKYRICVVEWMEVIVNSCKALNIPVFVKQMGTFIAKQNGYQDHHGGDIDEFPLTLQIRQFPERNRSLI